MKMRRLFVVAVTGLAVVAAVVVSCGVVSPGGTPFVPAGAPGAQPAGGGVAVQPGAPLPMLQDIDPEDLDPSLIGLGNIGAHDWSGFRLRRGALKVLGGGVDG